MVMVRYADDIVVGFEHRADAERLLAAMGRSAGGVCLDAASGEDPPDRVRPLCRGETASGAGHGKPETFDFLGLHAHLRHNRSGRFLLCRRNAAGSDAGQAAGDQGGASMRRRHERDRRAGRHGWGRWSAASSPIMPYPHNTRALSAFRYHVVDLWRRALRRRSQKDRTTWATDGQAGGRLAAQTADPPPMARATLRRHTPEVGAVCLNWARTVLCGGRAVNGRPYRDRSNDHELVIPRSCRLASARSGHRRRWRRLCRSSSRPRPGASSAAPCRSPGRSSSTSERSARGS